MSNPNDQKSRYLRIQICLIVLGFYNRALIVFFPGLGKATARQNQWHPEFSQCFFVSSHWSCRLVSTFLHPQPLSEGTKLFCIRPPKVYSSRSFVLWTCSTGSRLYVRLLLSSRYLEIFLPIVFWPFFSVEWQTGLRVLEFYHYEWNFI